jgi:hypothetical protein
VLAQGPEKDRLDHVVSRLEPYYDRTGIWQSIVFFLVVVVYSLSQPQDLKGTSITTS